MIKKIVLIAVVCVTLIVIGLVTWMGPRNLIGYIQYGGQVREGSLSVGDAAPIVPVVTLDGSTPRPLSEWIGQRPLVLVFGSFT
jgi:hypothetical protein